MLWGLLLGDSGAMAGVVFELEVKDHGSSAPVTELVEISVEGASVKMELVTRAREESDLLFFDGRRDEMVFIDRDLLVSRTVEKATLERLSGYADAALEHTREALRKSPDPVPPGVEDLIRRNLEQVRPRERPLGELVRGGERASKNGYPAARYEVRRDGRVLRELWVTEWSHLEGGEESADVLRQMASFFQEMVDVIAGAGQGEPPLKELAFEYLAEMDGFPVAIQEFAADGAVRREWTLRSVRRERLGAEALTPPVDYSPREVFAAPR